MLKLLKPKLSKFFLQISRPSRIAFVFLLLATISITVVFVFVFESNRQEQYNEALKQAKHRATRISYELHTRINLNKSISAFVEFQKDITKEDFEYFVNLHLQQDIYNVIAYMVYAPNLIVDFTVPIEFNKHTIGLDLTQRQTRAVGLQKCIEKGKSYVEGPLVLHQGDTVIISYMPFLVTNAITNEQIGGITGVVFIWNRFLEVAGLSRVNDVNDVNDFIDIAIRGVDGMGVEGEVFYGDSTIFHRKNAIKIPIILPMGEWIFAAYPKQWDREFMPFHFIFSYISAFIFALFIYIILNYSRRQILRQQKKLIRANKELAIANATKNKFFTIISHDLKNPLSALMAISETFSDSYDKMDKVTANQSILTLRNSAKYMCKLLENLSDWARSSRGDIVFSPAEHNVVAIIQNCINELKMQSDTKSINIKLSSQDVCNVVCDINMIRTVIRNLLSNAIKFSFSETTIEVGIVDYSADNNCIQVFVKDSGVGIDMNTMNKLFTLDTKIVSTKGTQDEIGTGLGLILCKEFIDKHNCKIWCESEKGKGTTFFFTLNRKM